MVERAVNSYANAMAELVRLGDPERTPGKAPRGAQAAKRFHMGQSGISQVLNKTGRLGEVKTLLKVHLITGRSIDQILGVPQHWEPSQLVDLVERMEGHDLAIVIRKLRDLGLIPPTETLSGLAMVTTPSTRPPPVRPPLALPPPRESRPQVSDEPSADRHEPSEPPRPRTDKGPRSATKRERKRRTSR